MLKKIFFLAALFWTGVILYFCLEDAKNIPQVNIQNIDKVIHAFFHFVFTTLWFLFLKKKFHSSDKFKALALAFAFSLFFGISIELMQKFFTTTRSADVFDVLANVFGATLAIITILLVNRYKRVIDKI